MNFNQFNLPQKLNSSDRQTWPASSLTAEGASQPRSRLIREATSTRHDVGRPQSKPLRAL